MITDVLKSEVDYRFSLLFKDLGIAYDDINCYLFVICALETFFNSYNSSLGDKYQNVLDDLLCDFKEVLNSIN